MADYHLYCERLDPGLLAEPVNALTNAAFLIAAWMLWRTWRRQNRNPPEAQLLIALIVAIGIGSSLFHTFATLWARVLDEVPILLFQLVFMWLYARRVIGWSVLAATFLAAGFLVLALYSRQFPEWFNGSLVYLPALAALLALGLYHRLSRKPAPLILLWAFGALVVALSFRTLDAAVCPYFPTGVHFLWHVLVALTAYLCSHAFLIASRNARRL